VFERYVSFAWGMAGRSRSRSLPSIRHAAERRSTPSSGRGFSARYGFWRDGAGWEGCTAGPGCVLGGGGWLGVGFGLLGDRWIRLGSRGRGWTLEEWCAGCCYCCCVYHYDTVSRLHFYGRRIVQKSNIGLHAEWTLYVPLPHTYVTHHCKTVWNGNIDTGM
jgi:hypothetical protein